MTFNNIENSNKLLKHALYSFEKIISDEFYKAKLAYIDYENDVYNELFFKNDKIRLFIADDYKKLDENPNITNHFNKMLDAIQTLNYILSINLEHKDMNPLINIKHYIVMKIFIKHDFLNQIDLDSLEHNEITNICNNSFLQITPLILNKIDYKKMKNIMEFIVAIQDTSDNDITDMINCVHKLIEIEIEIRIKLNLNILEHNLSNSNEDDFNEDDFNEDNLNENNSNEDKKLKIIDLTQNNENHELTKNKNESDKQNLLTADSFLSSLSVNSLKKNIHKLILWIKDGSSNKNEESSDVKKNRIDRLVKIIEKIFTNKNNNHNEYKKYFSQIISHFKFIRPILNSLYWSYLKKRAVVKILMVFLITLAFSIIGFVIPLFVCTTPPGFYLWVAGFFTKNLLGLTLVKLGMFTIPLLVIFTTALLTLFAFIIFTLEVFIKNKAIKNDHDSTEYMIQCVGQEQLNSILLADKNKSDQDSYGTLLENEITELSNDSELIEQMLANKY